MKTACIITCILLCLGCSVGPDFKKPTAEPVTNELFAGSEQHVVDSLATWWHSFQDPLLTKFIEEGLESSPTVAQAVHNLRSARALREGEEGAYWPQFTADGSYKWSRGWNGDGATGKWNKNLGASVDARWEIDLFGSVHRSVEVAEAEEAMLAYTLQDVRVSLIASIAEAYINARNYQTQVSIAEANIKLQEHNVQIVRKRYDAATASRYDLVATEAQLASTEAALPTLKDSFLRSMLELDLLLGLPPYTTKAQIEASSDQMVVPVERPKTLENELLRRRADIRKAEASLHAKTAAVGVATAELYPKFYLSGALGLSAPNLSPVSDYTRTVGFGPSVGWNIFGFGTYRKRVESAKENLAAEVASYKNTVLTAYREAACAWNSCENEMLRARPLFIASANIQDAYCIAQKRYKAGEIDFGDVRTQQGNLLTIQETLATHRAALFIDYVTLYKALGGGWADEASLVSSEESLLSAIEK